MFDDCVWLNEPRNWSLEDGALRVVTESKTDFWRETHYGFTRDSGHFFGRSVSGDFSAQIRVQAKYEELYDQAGLMLRIDETRWVKAGIEISDGAAMLSSVLTNRKSDWAISAYGQDASSFWIRATVAEDVLRLQVSADGKTWPLFRLAPFPKAARYLVGPMCCTPERSGLAVAFSDFRMSAPFGKDLHDLS